MGDPDDVISRYIGACEKYNLDAVVRITGDCPLVLPELLDYVLKSHMEPKLIFRQPYLLPLDRLAK